MKRSGEMTMDESRKYCLKLERDRERSHRKTGQGAFESAFMSLDAHVEKFDDPGKVAAFSDGGTGAERIFDLCDESERARQIENALDRLSENEGDFASAVLDGATWRELGIGKRGFNKRLAKICERLRCYVAYQNKDG